MKLKGFETIADIYNTPNRTVSRAIRLSDKKQVILKFPIGDSFTVQDLSVFKKEFEINQCIESPNVVQAIDLLSEEGLPILVFVDNGGSSLRSFFNQGETDIASTLRIAIKIAEGLRDIHKVNVIHKDIKPENIIFNPETQDLKITDFGISTLLARETSQVMNPEKLEGSLRYMSPEQTGRMNRSIDHRTDFYSFGISLYEMLTGRVPFLSNDPMELIHCHIARNPEPLHFIRREIPEILTQIVLKLMSKASENRYKTAAGIIHDLKQCLQFLEENETIPIFPLGQMDISDDFKIPQKLYGREEELKILLQAYSETSTGKINFLLLSGFSGIGKSALVHEIHRPVLEKRGYFISGKYDQFQRDIPYYALIQAFKDLIQQVLTENQVQINNWRNLLQKSLGANGKIILDIIPDLIYIIGKQKEVPELPPAEAQNRFENTFRDFIRTFTRKENPLALFLDDLQWADIASLNLIRIFLTDRESSGLLIIGAYRHNEVDIHHPLHGLLADLEKIKFFPNQIQLKPLELPHINDLISDSSYRSKEEAISLSELVLEKTSGNPFFVAEFLMSLRKNNLLQFNYSRSDWTWNIEEIRSQRITDNVVDLIANRIQDLYDIEQEILKLSSCLGSVFNLLELIVVSGKSTEECVQILWSILPEGIITADGDTASRIQSIRHEKFSEIAETELEKLHFSFIHDRVQQAAYQQIQESERESTHLKIGNYLLKNFKQKNQLEQITHEIKDSLLGVEDLVVIVGHLNKGSKLIASGLEKTELAYLNSKVAEKAEKSAAYSSANRFLEEAISLLPESSWSEEYRFTYDLYIRKAQCCYICGLFEESERLFSIILGNAKTNLDKGRIYEIKVVQFANQNQLVKAVEVGREGLRLFGVHLPKSPPLPLVLVEVLKATIAQGRRKILDIYDSPEATGGEVKMVARLLNNLTSPSYGTDQNLFAYVVVQGVLLALKKGVTESSAYMFGLYAALVGSKLGLFPAGEKYGHLGIKLSERFNNLSQRCRANFAMGTFVYAWTKPARESFEYSLESYRLARETGDNIYSCYAIVEYCDKLISLGDNLEETQKIVGRYTDYVVNQVQDKWIGTLMLAMNYSLLNLLGKTKSEFTLSTDDFDEEAYTKEINLKGQGQMDWYHTNKAKIFYFYGEFEKALEMATKAEEKMVYSFACMITAEQNFYSSLILSALIDKYPAKKRKYLSRIKKNNAVLSKWANASPVNFLHKFILVKAEIARLEKKDFEAIKLYDKALKETQEAKYLQCEALTCELAANYFLSKGQIRVAKSYMTDAYFKYQGWGGVHKIKRLETEWADYISTHKSRTPEIYNPTITNATNPTYHSGATTSLILDISTVIKSSQIISGEIRVSSLLEKMMIILMENAGAERAFFLVSRGDAFFVEAKCDLNLDGIKVDIRIPLETSEGFSKNLVNYVIRTAETLVIEDASNNNLFNSDEYIKQSKPKSILCMPIIYQTKIFGIIYLENNLMTGALTPARVELLKMLSSQISISLNNAILYSEMEQMAESFSRFVPMEFLEFLGKKSILDISVGDAILHKMTILFSDIRNFTGISEKMSAKDNFQFMNSYLKKMEPIIKKNLGFIDKFIGDAIMALFPYSPDTALKTCVEMKLELENLNLSRANKGYAPIRFGIGLHAGDVMLGTLGSKDRLDTTVIGDTVNLASRLEDMTKHTGTAVIVSDILVQQLKSNHGYQFRIIGIVKVKGKEIPVKIYELLDGDNADLFNKKVSLNDLFSEAFVLFLNRKFSEASILFAKYNKAIPEDIPSKKYIEVCQDFLKTPPSSDWLGTIFWY